MKKRISVHILAAMLVAGALALGTLFTTAHATTRLPVVPDKPDKPCLHRTDDVVVTLEQGAVAGESGSKVYVDAGDVLYYVVGVENVSEEAVSGHVSVPVPGLSEMEVVSADGASTSNGVISWSIDGLAPGKSVYKLAVLRMPGRLSSPDFVTYATFQSGDLGCARSVNVECSFGNPDLTLEKKAGSNGNKIVLKNSERATGSAEGVEFRLKIKSGVPKQDELKKNLPASFYIEDGELVIRAGAVAPGGKLEKDLGDMGRHVDMDTLRVKYVHRGIEQELD